MPKIDYIPAGEYLLPAIALRDPPDAEPLTKYGRMRRLYLKNHRPILYKQLLLQEKLYPHLRATQRAAEERLDTMMAQHSPSATRRRTKPPVRSHGRDTWQGCTTQQ